MSQPSGKLLPAKELERTHILQDIFDHVEEFRSRFDKIDYFALKQSVLEPVLRDDFNPEVQIRGFLKMFRHTPMFHDALSKIEDPGLRKQIDAFADGRSAKEAVSIKGSQPPAKPGISIVRAIRNAVMDCFKLKRHVEGAIQGKDKPAGGKDVPVIYEDQQRTKVMEVHVNMPFENWGQSIKNTPKYTFIPKTVHGVQKVVEFAHKHNYRVRCSGSRHSWSSSYSQDKEILISFVHPREATSTPNFVSIGGGTYNDINVPELKTIELKEFTSDKKRLCRVGVAATNEDFRKWAVAKKEYALPVDVILVEVTIGGVNAPICHGAGIRHKTISDYVRRVEYVDCFGKLQSVDDPASLRAAAGAFGLLGVVTHLTFELDPMTYAVTVPRKIDVGLAIPPIEKDDIPEALRDDWFDTPNADKLMLAAKEDFEKRAASDYYSEWFWFTYQKKAWVNTWNNVTDPEGAVPYPDEGETFLHWVEGWIGGIMTSSAFFNAIPGYWQAQLLATMGMSSLPPKFGENETPTIKTPLSDALHFRRGVSNMRVRDMEFQIPLPPRADDPTKADFSVVQRAWWDVIKLVYDHSNDEDDPSTPMRLTLELRIMGGSNLIMAAQRGNDLGTASIEVLTVPDSVTDKEWDGFLQKVTDKWMTYGNVRPHWAKEFENVRYKGREARDYMKNVAYKDAIPEFRRVLEDIGRRQNWSLADIRNRFSNELWDNLVFDV